MPGFLSPKALPSPLAAIERKARQGMQSGLDGLAVIARAILVRGSMYLLQVFTVFKNKRAVITTAFQ
jgi:hypothetical protein